MSEICIWFDKGDNSFIYHECQKEIYEVCDWIINTAWYCNPKKLCVECYIDVIDSFACELMCFMRDEFNIIGGSLHGDNGYLLYFMEDL